MTELVSQLMDIASSLDGQRKAHTIDVEDIAAHLVLPPKAQIALRTSQLLPQHHFRQGHLPAQGAGKIAGWLQDVGHWVEIAPPGFVLPSPFQQTA